MTFLDWVEMFKSLNLEEKEQLALFCQEKHILSWDELFKEWDEANAMYFLIDWKIEVYKEEGKKDVVLWKIKAEEILWEMAIFWWEGKRMASARAKEDTRLITILSFSIKQIAEEHPDLMLKIEEIIKNRKIENKNIKRVGY